MVNLSLSMRRLVLVVRRYDQVFRRMLIEAYVIAVCIVSHFCFVF